MVLIKKALLAYITFAFIFVVLGICFIAWPQTSIITVCRILGIVTLTWGIVKVYSFAKNKEDNKTLLYQFNLVIGIFLAIAGAFLLVYPKLIITVIPVIMSIMLLADGLQKVKAGLDARKMGLESYWVIELAAIITIIFAICLIINPFDVSNAMVVLLGISLLIDGVQNIIVIVTTFRLMSQMVSDEDAKKAEYVDVEIPEDPTVHTEEIKPEDMTIEDKEEE